MEKDQEEPSEGEAAEDDPLNEEAPEPWDGQPGTEAAVREAFAVHWKAIHVGSGGTSAAIPAPPTGPLPEIIRFALCMLVCETEPTSKNARSLFFCYAVQSQHSAYGLRKRLASTELKDVNPVWCFDRVRTLLCWPA
jgi:hypothetical protein